MQWSVMIADDEPMARRGVRQLLAPFAAFTVAGECRNGAEVLAALDRLHPDVVFLDIAMPGLGGFDVIRERTPERMPVVVFLTAYDDFAVRAFESEALDYLVKPVSDERFAATMRRITRKLESATPRPRRITVRTSRGLTVLPLAGIHWIEAADNYARLRTDDNRGYLIRESMRELERRLDPAEFIRAHRGALVRLASIRALIATKDGGVIAELVNGARVPVSRRRRASFVDAVRQLGRQLA
jgi:two-component system, LytTR family, response regulator